MWSFEKTSLWRASFGNPQFETESESVAALRACLINMRERATHLVSMIPRDIPGLTVHDITHLDALWETASLIAGDNYPLNPAEAFVFGATVLLHDAAMSLAAYPGGLDEVRSRPEWRDAVASLLIARSPETLTPGLLNQPPDEIDRAALAEVLRETHARRANELPFLKWPTVDGQAEYLIQDGEMREAYGNIIGLIAESHWWAVADLRDLPPRVNAGPKVPAAWYVHPLKIACLLRVADAAHIDHRRAPRFLRALTQPNPTSQVHWGIQSKLGKPSLDKNFLIYTGSPFAVNEAEAWWLGYDMLASIDDELRAVHGALDENGVQPFIATAVRGAKAPQAIAKSIPTRGWKPINAQLRVSNVPSLVELLGGKRLYGGELPVAVRELVQNSADAIRARRTAQNADLRYGKITVRLRRTKEHDWLEIEDDGIGMSARVLTGPLLDFGRSFWRSDLLRQEFPGLLSKGLKTTGRFGIGFFAVFMLGDRVTVTSRRYDVGVEDANTLEFQKGLRVRPILRKPAADELLSYPGTRVSVALRTRFDDAEGLLFKWANGDKKYLASLCAIVSRTSPAVDVTIDTDENGKVEIAIQANDWLTEQGEKLLERNGYDPDSYLAPELKPWLRNMRLLEDSITGAIYGRACFCAADTPRPLGAVTVGGFRATSLSHIAGMLIGETENVARDSATPSVTGPVLRAWATEQAKLIAGSKSSGEHKLLAASLVMLCGGEASELPVAVLDGEYLTADILEHRLQHLDEIEVHDGSEIQYDEDDDVRPKAFRNNFIVSPSLLLIPRSVSSILSVGDREWPGCIPDLYPPGQPKSCKEALALVLMRAWGEAISDAGPRLVGEVEGERIFREVTVYTRQDTLPSEVTTNSD